MEPKLFCQSCTMPIDNVADKGTEKDGTKSNEYCRYCYQNGSFTDPDITFEKMSVLVKEQMQKRHIPQNIIQKSMDSLPYLKRWNAQHA